MNVVRLFRSRPARSESLFSLCVFATLTSCLAVHAQDKNKPPRDFTNSIGMKFVWIPPGSFMMGSSKEEKLRSDDETQHKVTLSKGFYMGVHLVTQEQWQGVMRNNPSRFRTRKSLRVPEADPLPGTELIPEPKVDPEPKGDLPVDSVSWNDCQEFIKKLREKDKFKKPYRLPTEAEWEYACRAGTTTPFWCGETISTKQANYNGNFVQGANGLYRQRTTPVETFPANPWGLHDMHGNVWQWCQDWIGDYPAGDVVDPQGREKGQERVMRGGSWYVPFGNCRSACRWSAEPGRAKGYSCGFRLCFSVENDNPPVEPPMKASK